MTPEHPPVVNDAERDVGGEAPCMLHLLDDLDTHCVDPEAAEAHGTDAKREVG